MADTKLQGKRVAIVAADMVEQVELIEPRKALDKAGAKTELVSMKPGTIQGFNHFEPADEHTVDRVVKDADASDYDALMIPGGVGNPDQMRGDSKMVEFARAFFEQGKPVAAICHAPWLLVSAGMVDGRMLTSYHTIRDDIQNAGGQWTDRETVRDGNWLSSRGPKDIPAFNDAMIELFAEQRSVRAGTSTAGRPG